MEFQSTPSVWRETCFSAVLSVIGRLFQSTPSVWRETTGSAAAATKKRNFNPLPPCGGRRILINIMLSAYGHFNPLPPCGGRPINGYDVVASTAEFQSTPSVWRETGEAWKNASDQTFQSTPSVWRETNRTRLTDIRRDISIHSLRVEGDYIHSFTFYL